MYWCVVCSITCCVFNISGPPDVYYVLEYVLCALCDCVPDVYSVMDCVVCRRCVIHPVFVQCTVGALSNG